MIDVNQNLIYTFMPWIPKSTHFHHIGKTKVKHFVSGQYLIPKKLMKAGSGLEVHSV